MAVSTALKYHGNPSLMKIVHGLLNAGPQRRALSKKLCYKAGVPGATDTPQQAEDICVNVSPTPNTLYVNTTYDATGAANAWTKIA